MAKIHVSANFTVFLFMFFFINLLMVVVRAFQWAGSTGRDQASRWSLMGAKWASRVHLIEIYLGKYPSDQWKSSRLYAGCTKIQANNLDIQWYDRALQYSIGPRLKGKKWAAASVSRIHVFDMCSYFTICYVCVYFKLYMLAGFLCFISYSL